VHEAVEEHRMARLVDLLGGEEVLLLLARRGVDERRPNRSCVKSISVARQLPRSQRR